MLKRLSLMILLIYNQILISYIKYFFREEKCSMAISATVWGLGPEGWIARLLRRFLKNKGNEETEQEGCLKSQSWQRRRANQPNSNYC